MMDQKALKVKQNLDTCFYYGRNPGLKVTTVVFFNLSLNFSDSKFQNLNLLYVGDVGYPKHVQHDCMDFSSFYLQDRGSENLNDSSGTFYVVTTVLFLYVLWD